MKTSKTCRKIAPILEMTANGNATEQEIQNVKFHTETCGACHAEYQQWQRTANFVADWRTAVVPDSRHNWSDLHARLTAPEPQKLRPMLPVRLGLGGVVGVMAVGLLWLALPHPPVPSPELVRAEGESQVKMLSSAPVFVQNYEKQPPVERTVVSGLVSKMKTATPPPTIVKSEKSVLPSPREERAKRGEGSGVRGKRPLVAQTQPKPQTETPRRVILAVDGETIISDTMDNRYTLGAVPSGQVSGDTPRYVSGGIDTLENPLTPASYSSSEKTAW